MKSAYQLQLLQDEEVVHVLNLGIRPTHIGRMPGNDLVLSDPMISSHHAVLWIDNDGVSIKDLGSRNGTTVNGKRITDTQMLQPGDHIALGPDTRLVLREVEAGEQVLPPALMVEHTASGVCVPISSDRHSLLDESGENVLATLLVFEGGEVWLGQDTEDHPLEIDKPFEVGGVEYVVRQGDALRGTTAAPVPDRYPYKLTATLNGATGPEASLLDQQTGNVHRVTADNRAILLYLLARAHQDQRKDGIKTNERGWVSDAEILTGIWGRDAKDENKLHVLVYRLRNEVKIAGFDPWFIEKRRRYIRARLTEAKVS